MQDASDMELLREYERRGSEEAFAALVERHVHLVYSVAFRHVGNAAHAEEITQAVFVILARKAAALRPETILEGWLYKATRLTSLRFLRNERRRQFREQEAYMQSNLQESPADSTWNQLSPLLDDAVSRLGQKDRDAVMLRFFKDKSLREVAAALNIKESAAQRRVLRAVEKLRLFFARHGVVVPAAAMVAAISANSVQAAPAVLARTATAVAMTKGATAGASTSALIDGVLKLMEWLNVKAAITATAGALFTFGIMVLAVHEVASKSSAASAPGFGSVHEVRLNSSGQASYLDLETGRVLPDFQGNAGGLEAWKQTNSIDLGMGRVVTGKDGVDGYELSSLREHNSIWKNLPAIELASRFVGTQTGTNEFLDSGTYVIKTREGSLGIVQISLYNAYPRSMNIRYKLAQPKR